jgi:hypothetical protein
LPRTLLYIFIGLLAFVHNSDAQDNGQVYVYLDIPGMSSLKDAEVSLNNASKPLECRWQRTTMFVCSSAPFGWYSLHVITPGFRRVTAPVRIYAHKVTIRVGLTVDGLDTSPISKLSGRITGIGIPTNLWVRIMPVEEGPISMDGLVEIPGGKFEINGFDVGTYIFTLIDSDRNRVLCAHPVDLSIHTEVRITVNGENCRLTETQLK